METIADRPINETPDTEAIRAQLRGIIERGEHSQNAVARQVGVSGAAISQWLQGKYAGDNAAVEYKVRRLLGAKQAAADLVKPEHIPFQMTETSKVIWGMLTEAQHAHCMVAAAGVPGIGKTQTARAYQQASPNVWLVTLDPMLSSPNGVLTEIGAVMGIPIGSPVTLRHRIGEKLVGSEGLLIFDEAQYMKAQALDTVRSLYDRYGTGIAMLGNHGLFAQLSAPNQQHKLAQVFRRIRKRRLFKGASQRDIETILDAWNIRGREERQFMAMVAVRGWGFGGVENVIHEAQALAAGEGIDVALKHLKSAWAAHNHHETGA
ncbi:MAG: AAA family ATPase [Pseudomonadota bacterium]